MFGIEFPGMNQRKRLLSLWVGFGNLTQVVFSDRRPWSSPWALGHSLLLQTLERHLSSWMRNIAWLLRGRPTGGCPVAMTGYGSSWSVSSYFCVQLILSSPKTKTTLSKSFSQTQGYLPLPPFFFQKSSGHLALCLAHDKHSINICYFTAKAITSAVIFHFSKGFTAGFL